jgi:heterodisulfide reductase subunit A
MKENNSSDIKIGIYICHCGSNIGDVLDCKELAEESKELKDVIISKDYSYLCSEPGQKIIKEDIKEFNLNRIIIAACSPRLHEQTFREVLKEAGLNPYLLEIVNIREQCSWVHSSFPEKATLKGFNLLKMAHARVVKLIPHEDFTFPVKKTSLVIGGGIAGIQASLDLADSGYQVYLVEKKPSIGGVMAQIDKTFPTMDCSI